MKVIVIGAGIAGASTAYQLASRYAAYRSISARPFTADFLPVIGAISDWEGLLAVNGLGASGLTMGPYIGVQLAKLALGMALDIDLTDYDIRKAIG